MEIRGEEVLLPVSAMFSLHAHAFPIILSVKAIGLSNSISWSLQMKSGPLGVYGTLRSIG